MKTLAAPLATAQRTAQAPAVARASLADNGHLHLQPFADKGSAGVPSAACIHAGAIVRVRHDFTNFAYQRITDPTAPANWTAGWTSFGFSNVSSSRFTILSAGDYVVALWQDTSDADLKYSRSLTGGASWSSPATAYVLAGNAVPCGVSDPNDARAGIFFWNANKLWWGAYSAASNTWAAADDSGLSLTVQPHIGAAYDPANSRHILAITHGSAVDGSFAPVMTLARTTAGSWSTPRVYYLGATHNTTDQGGLHISQQKHNGYWWLSFWRFKWWTTADRHYLARSDDGLFWEDVIGLETVVGASGTQAKFAVIGQHSGYVWAADERYIFRSEPQTFWSNARIRTYELNMRSPVLPLPSPSNRGGPENATMGSSLVMELDNSTGVQLNAQLFAVLNLERGYNVAGTPYYQSAGTFYLTAYEYILQDNLLRLYATDAAGLLFLWRADQAFRWEGETIGTLVELICALAGVHQVSFDSDTIWSDTVPALSINPGATAYHALQSLAQRAAFNVRANEDGSLYFYLPAPSPAVQHTYSPTDHVHWPGRFGARLGANFVQIATPNPAHGAEAHDFASQSAIGHRLSAAIYDNRITAAADAAQLAAPRLLHAQEAGAFHDLESPPNFALELGDILEVLDSGFGEDLGPWRAVAFDEYYNPASIRNKFFQRVHLRGTA